MKSKLLLVLIIGSLFLMSSLIIAADKKEAKNAAEKVRMLPKDQIQRNNPFIEKSKSLSATKAEDILIYETDFETEGEWTPLQKGTTGNVFEWVSDDYHSETHSWHVADDVAMTEEAAVPTQTYVVSPEITLPTAADIENLAEINVTYWAKAVTPNTNEGTSVFDVWQVNLGVPNPLGTYWHTSETDAFDGKSWWCADPDVGTYGNRWGTSLKTPVLDLSAPAGAVMLTFKNAPSTETDFDYAHVEISGDGGATWTQLAVYDEENDPVVWQDASFDISAQATATTVVRWRLISDGGYESPNSWRIDNVKISDGTTDFLLDDGGDTGATVLIPDEEPYYYTELHYDYDDGDRFGADWALIDELILYNGSLDISDYAGETVVIAFIVSSDGWNRLGLEPGAGFYFDDVTIAAKSGLPNDVGVDWVYVGYPTTSGQVTPMAVDLYNEGFLDQSNSVQLWYKLDENPAIPVPPYLSIKAGGDTTKVFPVALDTEPPHEMPGDHTITAFTKLTNDENPENDELWADFYVDMPGVAYLGYDDRFTIAYYTTTTFMTYFTPLAEIKGTPSYNLNEVGILFYSLGGEDTVVVTIAEVPRDNPLALDMARIIYQDEEIIPAGDFSVHPYGFDDQVYMQGDFIVMVDFSGSNGNGAVLMDAGTPFGGHNIYLNANDGQWYLSGYGRKVNAVISYIDQPEMVKVVDVPNDQGGKVLVSWQSSLNDHFGHIMPIEKYVLWHKVDPKIAGVGKANVHVNSMEEFQAYGANAKENDIVSIGAAKGEGDLWRYVVTVPSHHPDWTMYSAVAGTWKDSTKVDGMYGNIYMVSAYTKQGQHVDSEEGIGYSVDNLAPKAPMGLAATETVEGNMVTWEPCDEEDFNYFILKRTDKNEALLQTTELSYLDKDVQVGKNYSYELVAVDFAGNVGAAAKAELLVTSVDGSMDAVPTEFALYNNYPNPFNPTTSIKYALPVAGHVTIKVLNIAGQEVATLVNEEMPVGYHIVQWDASNVGTGVYFYKIKAGKFQALKKMILTK